MSREQTPVLSGAIPSIKLLMSAWDAMAEAHPHSAILKVYTGVGVSHAQRYYQRIDTSPGYVLAMRELIQVAFKFMIPVIDMTTYGPVLNPMVRICWITEMWDDTYIEIATTIIKEKVRYQFNPGINRFLT